jgi:hypothetical protein
LDLSTCSATGNTITGASSPTNNHFNIFRYHQYIRGITLPSSLTSIGNYAFTYCSSLTSVTLPAGLISIGDCAFLSCTLLASATIPNGVTSIGWVAFFGCSSLASVTIPASVTTIDTQAFINCYSLTAFTVAGSNTAYAEQDGILFNKAKTTVLSVPGGKSGALTLPGTPTSIGEFALQGCRFLTSVTIPGSVTSIGYRAFYDCYNITTIIFGAGSNITTQWSNSSFPDDSSGETGNSLWTAYSAGIKPGTYTRSGSTWSQ